jgi:lysophospholipase L1-like esterase
MRARVGTVILANAIALVVFAIVALGILETYCRVVLDTGMRYEFEMWRYAKELKQAVADPELSFSHKPNSTAQIMGADVVINNVGLRDDRTIAPDKAEGTTRILMLGDSVTFGFGVTLENTASRRLQTLLNASNPARRFEVLDAGVGNYNTAMEVASYRLERRMLQPDIVVLNYFINDAEPTPVAHGTFLTRHSLAAVYLNNRFDSASRWAHGAPGWQRYYEDLYEDRRPAWQKTQAAIGALKRACDSDRALLLVVNYPDLHQTSPYPLESVTNKIALVAHRLDIPFLDLTPVVTGDPDPSRLWVNDGDPHPNAQTHARYAQAIETWLSRDVLLHYTPPRMSEQLSARQH